MMDDPNGAHDDTWTVNSEDRRLLHGTDYAHDSVDASLLEDRPRSSPVASLKYKLLKSFLIYNMFTYMGLTAACIAPSIDDLRHHVGCNYAGFTRAYMFNSIGSMFGSIAGGFLADRYQKHVDALMGLELILAAIARAVLPLAPNLFVMAALFAGGGFCIGAANPTANAHLFVIWGAGAASPMHLSQMGYGIGTIISPLIVEPFLAHSSNSTHNATAHLVNWPTMASEQRKVAEPFADTTTPGGNVSLTRSRIYIPYSIIGAFGILSGVLFILFYLIPSTMRTGQLSRVKERKSVNKLFNPGECADGRVVYGISMITLLLIMFVFMTGKDNCISTLMYAVAVDTSLAFSTLQGSLLSTGYNAAYAGGRAVCALIGIWVPVQILLFSEITGMLAVHITLALIGLDAPLNYWICICMSGFFAGPMMPSAMTWMDRYIEMTALALGALSVGLGLGEFLFNWLSGYLFQYYATVDLYYMSLGCGVGVTLCAVIGQILGCIHGDRYKKQQQVETEEHINSVPSDLVM